MSNTPFPIGGYFYDPASGNATAEAQFENQAASWTQLMGTAAAFTDHYVDQNQPISSWVSNAGYEAYSSQEAPQADVGTPVIGLPMASNNSSMTQDQQYQAFASGQYDSVIQGIVQQWASHGYSTQYYRPGWEMNLSSSPSYAGTDSQTQSDWVAAFQHISSVLHQAGQADGVNVKVVWNPNISNYDTIGVIKNLYPGNDAVDIIGADNYSDAYPYNPLYDWDKNDGTIDSSLSQWLSDPVNLVHYWNYPAATPYALDGSGGKLLDLQTLLAFAKAQGKPFAIPETGAGNSNGGHDVSDDAAFPKWLAQTLAASGDQIAFVNTWDANAGGNYDFSSSGANKPGEAAAWAQYFGAQPTATTSTSTSPTPAAPATVTIGSGSDTLALAMSEDAWQGDAQFKVTVDGTQVGGTQTVTASHGAGQSQTFDVEGSFSGGPHNVTVAFLNDAYGGTAATDRNLYVNNATIDGTAVPNSALTIDSGSGSFSFSGPAAATTSTAPSSSGTDVLDLKMAEDSWQGDAQYTISVDGTQVGGVRTATASQSSGATQDVSLSGNWGPGAHQVAVSFLNDAYGGSASTDRNLYVDGLTYDGVASTPSSAELQTTSTDTFSTPSVAGLTLLLAEDAYQGDAQYSVSLDGKQVIGTGTATALNSLGQAQAVNVASTLSPGTHDLAVTFQNDLYAGTPSTDRNLYVKGIELNGAPVSGGSATLFSAGTDHFSVVVPSS